MEAKPFWKSKGFWGSAIVVVLAICQVIDQQFGTQLASSGIIKVLLSLAGMFGLYGRVRANTKLTLTTKDASISMRTDG